MNQDIMNQLLVLDTDPNDQVSFANLPRGPRAPANAVAYPHIYREDGNVYCFLFQGGSHDYQEWQDKQRQLRDVYNATRRQQHTITDELLRTSLRAFIEAVYDFTLQFGDTATPRDIKIAANSITYYGANQPFHMYPDAPHDFPNETN